MKRARTAKRTQSMVATKPADNSRGTQTVTVPVAPPRNPYATLAQRRRAGAHGGSNRTRRQQEKRELREKLID
jgi:hypothetical protein